MTVAEAVAEVASRSLAVESEVVALPRVAWETYERLLADDEERRIPRLTYDRGVLEAVSPSLPHDEDALTITRLVDIVAANLGVPIRSVGGTTFRRRDLERGFEADASFYIQRAPAIRGRRQVDLSVDPPPDLVLEMEVSRSAVDKLGVFAAMGVPEVWRSDGQRVTILLLEGEGYRESASSLSLPALTAKQAAAFLALSRELLSPDWFHAVSDWARGQRSPD